MNEEYIYAEAKKIVSKKKRFYRHLGVYLAVNAVFFFIVFFEENTFEWLIPASLWGIGLFIHYFNIFGLPGSKRLGGSDWEQEEIERVMHKIMESSHFETPHRDETDELELKEIKTETQKNWKDSDLV